MKKLKYLLLVLLLTLFNSLYANAQENLSNLNDLVNNMVIVETGTFNMGATDGWGYDDERPIHEITLTSFKICKYEVTQKLWNLVMDDNPSTIQGDNLPVNNLSWNECQTFITKLNEKTGKTFRLPTEAEWEFAARGGINGYDLGEGHGYQYAGGYNNIEDMDSYVWYSENSDCTMHIIGTKRPNELGIYDMSGNVCEYVQDFFSSYEEGAQQDPTGFMTEEKRVFRGGSYERPAWQCRLASRFGIKPTEKREECGLRLAMDLSDENMIWYLVADDHLKIAMSLVGMLVAADDSPYFSVLDIKGNVLAENVLRVQFLKSEQDGVKNIKVDEPQNMLNRYVNNQLTLVGAQGTVNIYSVSGVKVASTTAIGKETLIDVSTLPTGIYIVKCGKLSFKFNKK